MEYFSPIIRNKNSVSTLTTSTQRCTITSWLWNQAKYRHKNIQIWKEEIKAIYLR